MTPHDRLKAAKDLEHLIGTPEPERPVYDEHPKMAPSIGDEIGKAYTENVRMISAAALSAGYGHIPPPGSAKFRICMKSLGDATINPTVCSQRQLDASTGKGVEPEDLVTGASQVLKADNIPNAAPARCTRMPEGWKCIRSAHHENGCFAYPVSHGVLITQHVTQSVIEAHLAKLLKKAAEDEAST